MKKALLGCFIICLLAIVGGGLSFYLFFYRPAHTYVRSLNPLNAFAEMNKEIVNQESFNPAPGAPLNREQVERFVQVHRSIRQGAGEKLDRLEQKYGDRLAQMESSGVSDLSLRDLREIWGDFGAVLMVAKKFQVEELNRQDFSLSEYEWVRGEIYSALGTQTLRLDGQSVFEAIRRGDLGVLTERASEDLKEENREALRPYEAELAKGILLAWLGL